MCYIDDVIIATETVEDHFVRLREVLECLKKAGFKCRVSKCSFMKTQTKYLGRVIKQDGMMPDPKAVVKLQQWNPPRNRSELSSFFGFTNYYREFIRDYAAIAHPLSRMLRKNNQFQWTEEAQAAFETTQEGACGSAGPNSTHRGWKILLRH